MKMGSHTPWGRVDSIEHLGTGIDFVGTSGHGGIKLDSRRNKKIPDYMRSHDGFYEEDCEYVIPMVVLRRDLDVPETLERQEEFLGILRTVYADFWEKYTGYSIPKGEERRQAHFPYH